MKNKKCFHQMLASEKPATKSVETTLGTTVKLIPHHFTPRWTSLSNPLGRTLQLFGHRFVPFWAPSCSSLGTTL